MDVRISDAELDVMEALWAASQPLTASEVAERIDTARGWSIQVFQWTEVVLVCLSLGLLDEGG